MKLARWPVRAKPAIGMAVASVAVLAACGVTASSDIQPAAQPSLQPSAQPSASGSAGDKTPGAGTPGTGKAKAPVPEQWWGDPKSNTIYLTFDDGPNTIYTPQILKILKDNEAKTTFFVTGNQVTTREAIVRQIKADGHLIGNHTWSHVALTGLSTAGVNNELSLARLKINGAGGAGTMGNCMRPPGGATDERVRKISEQHRLTTVMWNIDTKDWSPQPPISVIKNRILSARPGDIVLMHDAGGNRANTVAALAQALPILKQRGYNFAPVPVCGQQ